MQFKKENSAHLVQSGDLIHIVQSTQHTCARLCTQTKFSNVYDCRLTNKKPPWTKNNCNYICGMAELLQIQQFGRVCLWAAAVALCVQTITRRNFLFFTESFSSCNFSVAFLPICSMPLSPISAINAIVCLLWRFFFLLSIVFGIRSKWNLIGVRWHRLICSKIASFVESAFMWHIDWSKKNTKKASLRYTSPSPRKCCAFFSSISLIFRDIELLVPSIVLYQ